MNAAFPYVLHLDPHLQQLCRHDGPWVYGTLFVLIFAEATPLGMLFLPCDSLLFVTGTLAATGLLDPTLLLLTLVVAAVLGDSGNYWLGRLVCRRLFADPQARVFRREYLDKTDRFFARHGGKPPRRHRLSGAVIPVSVRDENAKASELSRRCSDSATGNQVCDLFVLPR